MNFYRIEHINKVCQNLGTTLHFSDLTHNPSIAPTFCNPIVLCAGFPKKTIAYYLSSCLEHTVLISSPHTQFGVFGKRAIGFKGCAKEKRS